MRPQRKTTLLFALFWAICFSISAGFAGLALYAIIHFVRKFW